jgi:hypothetical protein
MKSTAGTRCRDEGGTSRAGVVLVVGPILVLLVGAAESEGVRVHRA